MRIKLFVFLLWSAGLCARGGVPACWSQETQRLPGFESVSAGMPREEFLKSFPTDRARSLRRDGEEAWVTYTLRNEGRETGTVTFYFQKQKLLQWTIDDRDEVVREYMREFVSGGIRHVFPKTAAALERVLRALPEDVFLLVTDRAHPVIFVDHYTTGIARYAGSDEFVFEPDDPPAFGQGFYLIKVGDAMNDVSDPQAIEGVLLHEIAHRVLNHLQAGVLSCEQEREANRLVKRWGFEKKFAAAKKHFGSKSKEDSPCHEDVPMHEL
ncbi:MAG TPA: hypothetical protein DD723_02485 [Candidatus Omnitrophica bacterium]|nr:MAG: hypothetical protein A2Z81_01795 [Omnitrophica WOR_2 bacterium GWA2_45_18]OGX19474.1 MAG: hypothetical protein A2Y04_06305 [Omnitrophica WOR_2 bacterium GWC2_45_7]HBR14395.1 hypothetical protein [Candidatus Omnitrophota bacterium]